jgi:hypothetical protein
MEPEVKYGLQIIEDNDDYASNVYKVSTDETGVWIDYVASFADKEAAHAFIRAWNGEDTPL